MKKLKLADLVVSSFETQAAAQHDSPAGTGGAQAGERARFALHSTPSQGASS